QTKEIPPAESRTLRARIQPNLLAGPPPLSEPPSRGAGTVQQRSWAPSRRRPGGRLADCGEAVARDFRPLHDSCSSLPCVPSPDREPRPGENVMDETVRLAGATLDRKRHVCAFFNSKDEEYRVLLPFVREGFAARQRAFHIVDGRHRDEHLERLRAADIDVDAALADGQLEVRPWEDAYLRDGHFDQERMLALIEEVLRDGKRRGF